MARYYVRCSNSKCRARKTLRRHPDSYSAPPKCWSCGERRWTIDRWMARRDTRAMGCFCMAYNWGGVPHRKGSLHCWFNADGSMRDPPEMSLDFKEAAHAG